MAADTGWQFQGGDELWQTVDHAVISDADEVYLAISNRGEIDFVPGTTFDDDRDLVSTPPGNLQQVIAKFDATGNFQWATASSTGALGISELTVDGGGVFVAGTHASDIDLDVTDLGVNHELSGSGNYVAKLNAGSGKFEWVIPTSGDSQLASAKDGSSYVLLNSGTANSISIGDASFENTDGFSSFSVLAMLDATGNILRNQRLGSYQSYELTDIDVDDSSTDPGQWNIVGTGRSVDTFYFGDAAHLESQSTAGSSNADLRYTPGRDDHLIAFSLFTDGALKWANVYEADWGQKGFEVLAGDDGSIYIDARTMPEGSFRDAPGTTVFDASRADGAMHGAGDFLLRLSGNGSFGDVLHNEGSLGTYRLYNADSDGLVLGIVPDNPTHSGSSTPAANFEFGDYLLEPNGDASEFVFRTSVNFDVPKRLFLSNPYDTDGDVGVLRYAALNVEGSHVTAAGSFEGTGKFADGTSFDSPYNENLNRPSSMVFATGFELPESPALKSLIFLDSFEQGQWNGLWEEDSQNDWFRSSQRATVGSVSAEVDGNADNATLNLANPIDLTGYESVELSFDWLIESGFDSGEYIAVDAWDGSTWVELNRRRGNVDAENVWDSQTLTIDPSLFSSDFRIRFRAEVSRYNEDANVDNVRIIGIASAPQNQAPSVNAGADQTLSDNDGTGRETAALSGSAYDSDGTIVSYEWSDGTSILGTAPVLTQAFDVGTHTLTLTVTDDEGATATDSVAVTVDANKAPTADGGTDFSAGDDDGDGSEVVTLSGRGSDADGSIVSYEWKDGETVLGTTASISPALSVGTHALTFTVTDNGGASDSDTVVVTVDANVAPTADGGADQSVTDDDGNGSQVVTLTGSGSDSDGSIVGYEWKVGETVLGTTASISPTLEVGTHAMTFTVTDNGGASTTDSVLVTVKESAPGPNLSHGDLTIVGSSWQTITLDKSYTSMVVVATPRYNAGSGPGVVRINNVTSNSFDVRVDSVGATAFSGGVHFVAVEEGVYDEPGFKLEAVKYSEAETSRKNGWLIDSASYQQAYNNPVVVGQVMSANDPNWSVFWASSDSRTSPPTSSQLNVGKHVAEDPDATRAAETVGYLVIEATQAGMIEGLPFVAGVGGDSVRGVGNGTYQYSYTAMPNAKAAVLSSAGMDGGDGGWAVLRGNNPLPFDGGTIDLAIDEDQLSDSERNHTTEQVAYFVIDPPMADPMDVNGDSQVTAADALRVINQLARNSESSSDSAVEFEALDVNRDGLVSALDALVLINQLRRQSMQQANASITSPEAVDAVFATPTDDDEETELVDQLLANIL